ncbi:thiamine pyrophosphate-dependent dehydrogenase E1 component subunit alpha [Humidisolicoccus flavus]|uniref:thiamine pyrophosphate-dependent dehydrogenase E1 component subunit alpha n=1 Tax=Humidisolicoccus flavus TaxID=3111414 RepID=UPI003250A085
MAENVHDNKDIAREALGTMWKIRRFEEAVEDLYGRGLMHGTMHLSIGQEAVPTGACLALRKDDYITSTHRGHGHCIAKGADMERMMAELLAKETGYCRGRGGSMHIADFETGNLGANGIVAGGVPIAAGAALTAQMRGTDQVAVSFHGDGAMGEGAWHEAVVLAVMWQLPVIFICENNKYGMSMDSERAFNLDKLSDRALGYGLPGVTVDGNDVQEVYDAVDEAVQRARSGGGPTFIEALTYRWRGHSKSDKNLYRTREEIDQWRERDPIGKFENSLVEAGTLTQADVEAVRAEVRNELRTAVQRANAAPDAQPEGLLEAVYATEARA